MIRFIIIFIILYNSSVRCEENENKIPAHVFVFENIFMPGAGHIYNDHLGLAFWSFFGTINPLILFQKYKGSANDLRSNNQFTTEPSLSDIRDRGSQKSYLQNREYQYNIDASNTFLLLAVMNYLDSFIESYYAANNNMDDNLDYKFGLNAFISAMQTRSITDNFSNIANTQDVQQSIGLTFVANYGHIFEKELLMHLGSHFVFSYNYMFPIKINKTISLFVGNHFDMQKKIFNFSINAPWTSYDRYMLLNDIIGVGVSLTPIKALNVKAGVGVFTLSTIWKSFCGTEESFSQAHAGKTGLFTTSYLWGSAQLDIYKNLFIGGRFKYLSTREPLPNYDAITSYIDFIRLEAIVGVSF